MSRGKASAPTPGSSPHDEAHDAKPCVLAALGIAVGAPLAGLPASEPYEINAILPLTGPGTFLGRKEAEALTVAEAVINKSGGITGRPMRPRYRRAISSRQT